MLDLDDLSQIALADREKRLRRAANWRARWGQALERGHRLAGQTPRPQPLAVRVPRELFGVAKAVQRMVARSWGATLEVHVGGADGGTPLLGMADTPPSSQPPAAPDLGEHLHHTDHPGDAFLLLVRLLEGWQGRELAPELDRAEAELAERLEVLLPGQETPDNPAKTLARQLNERLPVFWALEPFAPVAYDWWLRYLLYAELKAQWATDEQVRYVEVMARFPRYWPNTAVYVRLAHGREVRPGWLEGLETLFRRRRIPARTVAAPAGLSEAQAMLYLLELGEWVALYAACLNAVDPAARVPLDFLAAWDEEGG